MQDTVTTLDDWIEERGHVLLERLHIEHLAAATKSLSHNTLFLCTQVQHAVIAMRDDWVGEQLRVGQFFVKYVITICCMQHRCGTR